MKLLNVIFILLCFSAKAQNKSNHSSELLNISFSISENARVKILDSVIGETYFVMSEEKEFEYTLTINKFPSAELTFEDFKGDEFKNLYLKTCNCTIESEKQQYYSSLKTYQYTTITEAEDQKLYGLIDYIEIRGDVYAFLYLTNLVNYERFKSSYREVLETVKF